jgi:UDP-N-acetylglucosamine:LPS N-acetylglucosamine transferase
VLADRNLNATTLREALLAALAPARLQTLREAAAALGARQPHAAIVARVKSWTLAKTSAP